MRKRKKGEEKMSTRLQEKNKQNKSRKQRNKKKMRIVKRHK